MTSQATANPISALPLLIRTLEGDVTVAYSKLGVKWHCTALQFDLVGIGKTRDAAFTELQEVVHAYLLEAFTTKGKVRVFNPSDREEWDNPDKHYYRVTLVLMPEKNQPRIPARLSYHDATRYRRDIRSVQLTPSSSI